MNPSEDAYQIPPVPTAEHIESVAAFITARLDPMISSAYGTDAYPALNALNDVTHYLVGRSEGAREGGDDVSVIGVADTLAVIARRWEAHPDFLKGRRP